MSRSMEEQDFQSRNHRPLRNENLASILQQESSEATFWLWPRCYYTVIDMVNPLGHGYSNMC